VDLTWIPDHTFVVEAGAPIPGPADE
jgi:hypothetical protein